MDNFNGYTSYDTQSNAQDRVQDITVKTFMYMFFALIVSGFFAFVTYATGNAEEMIRNGTFIILIFVEIATVIITTILVRKNLPAAAAVCGTIYCIVNGLTLSVIFLAYEMQSIVAIFFVTAAIFGAMALYGSRTKKDLTSIGSLCYMALIGIILITIINIFFLKSEGLDLVLSYVGVLIFVGLTAYDTQMIRRLATSDNGLSPYSIAILCALNLYLDFINLFLKLLRIFAKNR